MKEKFNKCICDFEGCRHRNEEKVCCLFNQENCVYFRKVMDLKSENLALDRAYTELYKQYEEVKANADYQLEGRDITIKELKAQIEKMKCCSNCDNWNWKHSKCEKKLKGDCFKQSKWILRR